MSDDKIQITILILRRGALSTLLLHLDKRAIACLAQLLEVGSLSFWGKIWGRGKLLLEGLNVGGESLTVAQSEGGGGAISHFLGNQLDQRRFVHCFGVFNESISEQPFTSVS